MTTNTWGRRSLFQTDRMASLLIDVLADNRKRSRFQIHEFVIMPHVHAILTPAFEIPLERAVQFIKGGFSFRAKKELGFMGEIWQTSFTEHRIKDADDCAAHRSPAAGLSLVAGGAGVRTTAIPRGGRPSQGLP
ncbi:MAG: transposase [Terriglobales bacterium]